MSISEALSISDRFLETILAELRRAGLVKAYRGRRGGYTLAMSPTDISVGRMIQLFDGPMLTVDCLACGGGRTCPSEADCAFAGLWLQANAMVEELFNGATVQDLLAGTFAAGSIVPDHGDSSTTADSPCR